MVVLPDFSPRPETSKALPGKVTLMVTFSESSKWPISKVKESSSWLILDLNELLLNCSRVMSSAVNVQDFPLLPLLAPVLTSPSIPKFSSKLLTSQPRIKSPFSLLMTWVTSTVSFL